MIDYAAAGEWLEAYGRAWQTFDGDAWVGLFTEDAEYHEDPFGAPLVGHNALRAYLLEAAASETRRRVHGRAPLGLGGHGARGLARGLRHGSPAASTLRLAGLPDRGDGGRRAREPLPRVDADTRPRRRGRGDGGSMAGDQSFDVVSDFDEQELRNALDQVRREVGTRYDFKGVTVDLTPGQGRARPRHRRRAPRRGGQGPDRVEGDPAQPVAEDLRLGQGRAGRRQQGPPADRAAPRPDRRASPRRSRS